jgi:enediyne biosynthesis protein E4
VPGGSSEKPIDPNVQIKFALIFGTLAFIPFVLFFIFGLDRKESGQIEGTNSLPAIRFVDITEESGLRFTHVSGATGEKLLPETMGGGCAFLDFDNDGDQDILLINSATWDGSGNATHALFANEGQGRFTDVTRGSGLDFSSYGMGTAIADYNGDGLVDILITGVGGNRLLKNTGKGKFVDVTEAAGLGGRTGDWSTSAAFFDYDRDGDLDLFICNYVQWSREIDLQVDYRLPSVGRAYGPPMSFAGTFSLLYRNNSDGTFTDVSAEAGVQIKNRATSLPMAKSLGVAPVDLDGDGWMDLVIANDTVQNFVFHNNKNGTFTEMGGRSGLAYDKFGSTRGAMGIDTGRFRNDDTLAISIGNFANEMTAFYVAGEEPLYFSDEALDLGIGGPTRTLLTFGVFFFDYDLDGYLDLLTANGHIEPEIEKVFPAQRYKQPAQLFWNSARGLKEDSFLPVPREVCGPDLFEPMVGRGSAFADIDGDGDLDVLITQVNGPVRLLRNEQKLGRNWVRLKLVGKKGNLDAIGARVRLRVGPRVLSQHVVPTRGYLAQSELPITFGLGSARAVDDIQVFWPDGTRESGMPIQINAVNEIRQR